MVYYDIFGVKLMVIEFEIKKVYCKFVIVYYLGMLLF